MAMSPNAVETWKQKGKLYEQGQQNSNGNEEWVLGIDMVHSLMATMSMQKCFSPSNQVLIATHVKKTWLKKPSSPPCPRFLSG